ncbi:hypothetical protein J1614_006174 [Plenodomus biglobosus]|nr:hypothetical protein J1614_006174 [Plenodomus biglobosus]
MQIISDTTPVYPYTQHHAFHRQHSTRPNPPPLPNPNPNHCFNSPATTLPHFTIYIQDFIPHPRIPVARTPKHTASPLHPIPTQSSPSPPPFSTNSTPPRAYSRALSYKSYAHTHAHVRVHGHGTSAICGAAAPPKQSSPPIDYEAYAEEYGDVHPSWAFRLPCGIVAVLWGAGSGVPGAMPGLVG